MTLARLSRVAARVIILILLPMCLVTRARGQSPQGYGQATTGGAGYPIVYVTTLADYDATEPVIPGSLRQALTGSNRRIHFSVGGEILLKRKLELRGQSNVTLDGSTAPPPGVTLKHDQFEIRDSRNIIVRHLRSRDTADRGDNIPGFMIYKNCANIWLDHLSVSRASDESIGVYGGGLGEGRPTDITLSWNLIADADDLVNAYAGKAILVSGPGAAGPGFAKTGEFADRVSIHHNILTRNHQRNPQIAGNSDSGVNEPRVDFRNNIVHDWYYYGARLRYRASANLVRNVFLSHTNPEDALLFELPGLVYVSGNVAPPQGAGGVDINSMGTTATPLPAPAITEHPVQDLPAALIGDGLSTGAGALPRDVHDTAVVERLAADFSGILPTCYQLGGTACGMGEVCSGGVFTPSSDAGSLCCVGGACSAPTPGDKDGDGVDDLTDNCPADYNPGQQNSDGDAEGGDACDITVTYPLGTQASCTGPPPTITWTPESYDRFKVFVGADPLFNSKVTSGKRLLTVTYWTIPPTKWLSICAKTSQQLYIKVKGKRAGTTAVEYSEVAATTVK